ncbi:type IV toxin-antitoxin system AbiEi family antitoxin domain-containing protein [Sinomonas sp. ASV322]|uniref:type IV toxin-antitoxin system AbiEi family antitoxin domain-containing protein n=1 Tax=Sinomonas sp. ASV322 TaxID=3041920 RepID=UPI0027DE2309|nr:type IV toxin-antitoxin system AbiEi family antitoxin domain-containing protein [Sinomonas sp. ASV322]MDQ4502218.1 type IV toxin-antitoxin system AbiEi family antitoxin domain-containing protein [Sinomonas sp. ASV322]
MDLNLDPRGRQRVAAMASQSSSPVPMLTYHELRAAGLDTPTIRNLIAAGDLTRRGRGVYLPWLSERSDPMIVRIFEHNTASSGSAHVYTHTSAALIWGLSVWRARPLVHVAHSSRRGDAGPAGDVVRHNQRIPETELRLVDGLRVTSLERTIIDCARLLPFEQAVVIADSGLARGARPDLLRELVAEGRATRGIRNVRTALQAADGRAESPAETRFRLLLDEWNLPQPELQVWIQTAEGRYRVDFAWSSRRIVIEVHGYAKYFDYGPIDTKVAEQRTREAGLLTSGWRVLNVYWPELDNVGVLRRKVSDFIRTPHAALGV